MNPLIGRERGTASTIIGVETEVKIEVRATLAKGKMKALIGCRGSAKAEETVIFIIHQQGRFDPEFYSETGIRQWNVGCRYVLIESALKVQGSIDITIGEKRNIAGCCCWVGVDGVSEVAIEGPSGKEIG